MRPSIRLFKAACTLLRYCTGVPQEPPIEGVRLGAFEGRRHVDFPEGSMPATLPGGKGRRASAPYTSQRPHTRSLGSRMTTVCGTSQGRAVPLGHFPCHWRVAASHR
jgi:hypothetical protein